MCKLTSVLPNKVYYLEFNKILDPIIEKQAEEQMLLLFKSIMTPSECDSSVIFGENDSLFLFIDEHKVNKIIDRTESMGIFKSSKEISIDILTKKYIDDNFNKTFSGNQKYKNILADFTINNLTPDLVLDKISENGIGSLTIFDYSVLKSLEDEDNTETSPDDKKIFIKKTY